MYITVLIDNRYRNVIYIIALQVVESLMDIVKEYSDDRDSESPSQASTVISVPSKSSSMDSGDGDLPEVKGQLLHPIVEQTTDMSPQDDSTPRDTSSDETSQFSSSPDGVADILSHITRAKDDTLEILTNEYEVKLTELNRQLNVLQHEKDENETEIESLKDQLEDALEQKSQSDAHISNLEKEYKEKIIEFHRQVEQTADPGPSETSDSEALRKQLSDEYKENIDLIRREYEEKMELLRQELQEVYANEREDLHKQHSQEMQEKEEKYDTLLDSEYFKTINSEYINV